MELESHRRELGAYCYRMTGSFHEAEDLVQETMLRAWKARDRHDPARASVRTWPRARPAAGRGRRAGDAAGAALVPG
ncbi:sigma factor [Kitasatospora sp. DSM 101779]|uniref:sigma factor n=1 Tax=Kitasatospora sp. DSM 101779 TaxID=2853165 RepID=UPI002952E4E2|nr:sigma factor [Kitasatospora sp. DSM 101779]